MENIIEIIEENLDWIAVSKPAGLSVHNDEDGFNLLSILEEQLDCSLHAAHRLDQPTSGVMLLGKHTKATTMLQEALTKATKEYTAILRGVMKPNEGTWGKPLTNKGEGFRNPQGRKSDRVHAQTFYRVLRSNDYFTQVKLRLGTGRQHQIRKHAVLAKHQVVGDSRYGERRYNSMITKRYGFDELCLCASKLEVTLNGVPFCFEAPLPKVWSKLIE